MSNFCEMTLQWLRKKSFKLLKCAHMIIALKHVIWRFQICYYFCEISKFRDFMNTERNFAKSVFAHISAKFKYLAKQFILTESRSCALK